MNTEQIMGVALRLAGIPEIPTDSGIWMPGSGIRRVLVGVDITSAELLAARQEGFDLVIAHHPPEATLEAWRVFLRHVDQMVEAGVPRDVAEAAVAELLEPMQLRAQGRNYDHTVSVARLLGMPFMNVHLPLDEIGRQRLRNRTAGVQDEKPGATVGDLVDALSQFGEVRNAATQPRILCGDAGATAGHVVVSHAALDIPTYAIMAAYFSHGVDTLVTLRAEYADVARIRREKAGNWISVGHLVVDSMGINPFLSALEEMGLEITRLSGVIPG